MNTAMRSAFFLLVFVFCSAHGAVPTAEEYAHSLEMRFTNGESAASIRMSFETNELYAIYDILPYCYDYAVDTNDLEGAVSRYQAKLAFIKAIMPEEYFEVSSSVIAQTAVRLNMEHAKLRRCIRMRYEDNPTPENYAYWKGVYPRAFVLMYSGPAEVAIALHEARVFTKDLESFFRRFMFHKPCNSFRHVLNLDSYSDVFSRADLYAELATNIQYNADDMFKYCLTENSDFATNNIAIAEKQIWRNNFVLEIVTHSCNLHTNEKNRAFNAAYTNKLADVLALYDAIPEPHLGMAGEELRGWKNRLRNTIHAYVDAINPFRTPTAGEPPQ